MSIIEWQPEFELKVDEFDEHHKHLFDLLNAGYDEFVSNNGKTKVAEILDELIDYATYHFSAEEYWMMKHHFPGIEDHKEQHAYFTKRVVEMHRDLGQGNDPPLLEVITFIKNWIASHILITDAEYGRYVATKYS